MKNFYLVLILMFLTGILCLAETIYSVKSAISATAADSNSGSSSVKTMTEAKTIEGTIDSVSVVAPSEGRNSTVILVDDMGKKIELMVKSSTVIYDTNWKVISLDNVKRDSKVSVEYIADKSGLKEALSINLKEI